MQHFQFCCSLMLAALQIVFQVLLMTVAYKTSRILAFSKDLRKVGELLTKLSSVIFAFLCDNSNFDAVLKEFTIRLVVVRLLHADGCV